MENKIFGQRTDKALDSLSVSGRSVRGSNGENVLPESVTIRYGRSKTATTGKTRSIMAIESAYGHLLILSADRYGQWNPTFIGGSIGYAFGEKRFSLGKVNWKGQRADNGAWSLTNVDGLVTICHNQTKVNYVIDLADVVFTGIADSFDKVRETVCDEATGLTVGELFGF